MLHVKSELSPEDEKPADCCEEEDPVVQQLPVFCSRRLADRLWLLQYPVRPGARGYSHAHARAQLRPQQKQLRLQVPLDTTGPSYDPSRGQQMALNSDGPAAASPRFQSGYMDHHELLGRRVDVEPRRYCLGTLQADGAGGLELHLASVAAVLTVRPAFDHLEPVAAANPGPAEGEEPGPGTVERVTVKFARFAGARVRPDPLGARARQSEEPWQPAAVFPAGSQRARSERALLAARGDPGDAVVPLPGAEYRDLLVPGGAGPGEEGSTYLAELPLRQVRGLALSRQLEALLARQHVCGLQQLLDQVVGAAGRDAVVRQLQQVGRLVCGLWVARSELLFPADDPRVPARDLLLYWFTQRRLVTRQQLLTAAPLSREHALQLLGGVAVREGGGWRLKLPPDPDTERCFPELVQRQQLLWTARHAQLTRLLAPGGDVKPARSRDSGESGPQQARRRSSSRRQSDSLDSKLPSISDQHFPAKSQPVT